MSPCTRPKNAVFFWLLSTFQAVQKVFVNLPELYGLSVQLLASLDECMEMAGEVEGVAQCPQAGFVFEEIAEVRDASVQCIYNMQYIFCYI